jgi:hypothetical protein
MRCMTCAIYVSSKAKAGMNKETTWMVCACVYLKRQASIDTREMHDTGNARYGKGQSWYDQRTNLDGMCLLYFTGLRQR